MSKECCQQCVKLTHEIEALKAIIASLKREIRDLCDGVEDYE